MGVIVFSTCTYALKALGGLRADRSNYPAKAGNKKKGKRKRKEKRKLAKLLKRQGQGGVVEVRKLDIYIYTKEREREG